MSWRMSLDVLACHFVACRSSEQLEVERYADLLEESRKLMMELQRKSSDVAGMPFYFTLGIV